MTRAVAWRLAVVVAAFWPVWAWYVRRLDDGSDEPFGLVALAIAAIVVATRWRGRGGPVGAPSDAVVAGSVALYTVSFAVLPSLLRASLAMITLALLLSPVAFGRRLHLGLYGLLLLSLPVIASVQFYFGYPLRVASAEVAAAFTRWQGFEVAREGVALVHAGEALLVDAPCSGVRMLWVTGLVVCALGCLSPGTNRRLFGYGLVAIPLVVLGNGLRAASLFFLEHRPIASFQPSHDAVGLACLALVLLPLVALMHRGGSPCAPSPS